MAKLTTEEFIKKAREVHGDKYDYSKVEYVDAQTDVCIICRQHGSFGRGHLIILLEVDVRNVLLRELLRSLGFGQKRNAMRKPLAIKK